MLAPPGRVCMWMLVVVVGFWWYGGICRVERATVMMCRSASLLHSSSNRIVAAVSSSYPGQLGASAGRNRVATTAAAATAAAIALLHAAIAVAIGRRTGATVRCSGAAIVAATRAVRAIAAAAASLAESALRLLALLDDLVQAHLDFVGHFGWLCDVDVGGVMRAVMLLLGVWRFFTERCSRRFFHARERFREELLVLIDNLGNVLQVWRDVGHCVIRLKWANCFSIEERGG